ncbi:MAG: NADH-quinone oxidoreductase subunit M [Chloroflexia bacterium]|nr:NADH-quinone oxidoreductase subunit M [Chloroflexia bacterium]MDQ3410885.1 NADH-quinone oxidoreductase subunit M [Chloroflexota bacterium]
MDNFPILTVMTFLPLLGALVTFFVPHITREAARMIALITALGSFVLSVVILFRFERNAEFQFTEELQWLPDLGVSYYVAVDGIAVLLIALTTLLSLIAIIWSWDTVNTRTREYYIALLLLETGMIGVFVALDLFLFYIFWELMLIPMALLIGIWGSSNRVYAAIKFFLYTLFGSLLMLVAIVATYQAYYLQTGERTLNVLQLAQGDYGRTFQFWVFAAFFIAFAVKVPMFPFHTWLPDAHVEAPTAASVILAAVMLKMGGYGLLRFNLPLYPEASVDWGPVIITLSVIAILYGAFVALVQTDMKKLIAYSSVSHMGFVTLGIFVFNLQGMDGAMLVMLAHGFNTGALFLLVGVIYERAHTRLISAFGGLASRMPIYSAFFLLFMLASIGLPGLSGFVGEFLVALGAWQYNPWIAAFTFAVVIFAAWYMMWLFQRVIFGRAPGELPDPHDGELTPDEQAELAAAGDGHGHGHAAPLPISGGAHDHPASADHGHAPGATEVWPDLTLKEALTLIPLAVLTIVFGIFPGPLIDIVEPAFERILAPFL